jgi:hypothetical protein
VKNSQNKNKPGKEQLRKKDNSEERTSQEEGLAPAVSTQLRAGASPSS